MRRIGIMGMMLIVAGCGGITLGPVVKREFVVVEMGQPVEVLSNVVVEGRRLEDDAVVKQRIGGWYVMPREHFERLAGLALIGGGMEEKDKGQRTKDGENEK